MLSIYGRWGSIKNKITNSQWLRLAFWGLQWWSLRKIWRNWLIVQVLSTTNTTQLFAPFAREKTQHHVWSLRSSTSTINYLNAHLLRTLSISTSTDHIVERPQNRHRIDFMWKYCSYTLFECVPRTRSFFFLRVSTVKIVFRHKMSHGHCFALKSSVYSKTRMKKSRQRAEPQRHVIHLQRPDMLSERSTSGCKN